MLCCNNFSFHLLYCPCRIWGKSLVREFTVVLREFFRRRFWKSSKCWKKIVSYHKESNQSIVNIRSLQKRQVSLKWSVTSLVQSIVNCLIHNLVLHLLKCLFCYKKRIYYRSWHISFVSVNNKWSGSQQAYFPKARFFLTI